MRFQFVNKITRIDGDTVEALSDFSEHDEWVIDGGITKSVISEAIGQAISWVAIEKTGFKLKPIFIFTHDAKLTTEAIPAGSSLRIVSKIVSSNETAFVFSGTAYLGDDPVVTITNCGHFWLPIDQLEDPETVRKRYELLISTNGVQYPTLTDRFNLDNFCGKLEDLVYGKSLRSIRTFLSDEPYFKDHFSRMPVVPLTLVNEMLGRETARVFNEEISMSCVRTSNLRMKDFIRPGETIQTVVEIKSHEKNIIKTAAKIFKNDLCIMRGDYEYQY